MTRSAFVWYRRTILTTATLGVLLVGRLAFAEPPINVTRGNTAIGGYDPVAYFTNGRAVPGHAKYEFEWQGARWRFASAEHRDLFVANPRKYAPQYGGYCAWAVSRGYTADIDPEAWYLHEGRLYLNYSTSVRARWLRDVPGNIAKANANWPKVLDR